LINVLRSFFAGWAPHLFHIQNIGSFWGDTDRASQRRESLFLHTNLMGS